MCIWDIKEEDAVFLGLSVLSLEPKTLHEPLDIAVF